MQKLLVLALTVYLIGFIILRLWKQLQSKMGLFKSRGSLEVLRSACLLTFAGAVVLNHYLMRYLPLRLAMNWDWIVPRSRIISFNACPVRGGCSSWKSVVFACSTTLTTPILIPCLRYWRPYMN